MGFTECVYLVKYGWISGPKILERGLWDFMHGLIISRFQVPKSRKEDFETSCTVLSYPGSRSKKSRNSVNEHLRVWNGVLNISGFQVPKSQKQGGLQTLAPGAASYYIPIPSPKTTKRTLGPGTVSSYIEVPKSPKEGREDFGAWNADWLYWGLKISKTGSEDFGTWDGVLLCWGPKVFEIWREDVGSWSTILLYWGPKIS